ncbi:MAG: Hpt domain-containing protein, partial [Verrucomicrobiota bacterium]
MAEDDDDYQALFFTECEELHLDLQEQLNLLQEGAATGDFDLEGVNAAFRAVHSIKGGAAAFGFDNLTSFAHLFESLMDQCRSGARDVDEDVAATLLRSCDAIEVLISEARHGSTADSDLIARVEAELKSALGEGEKAPPAAAKKPTADTAEDDAPRPTTAFELGIKLHSDFLTAGHDPLRLFRDLKS